MLEKSSATFFYSLVLVVEFLLWALSSKLELRSLSVDDMVCFDRDGRFGSVTYDQNKWKKMLLQVKTMLNRKLTDHEPGLMMSGTMDVVIDRLIDRDNEAKRA